MRNIQPNQSTDTTRTALLRAQQEYQDASLCFAKSEHKDTPVNFGHVPTDRQRLENARAELERCLAADRAQRIVERQAEAKRLGKMRKADLLALFSRLQRVNSADARTSKGDLICAILECTHRLPRHGRI